MSGTEVVEARVGGASPTLLGKRSATDVLEHPGEKRSTGGWQPSDPPIGLAINQVEEPETNPQSGGRAVMKGEQSMGAKTVDGDMEGKTFPSTTLHSTPSLASFHLDGP